MKTRNIREVKVGDIIHNWRGEELLVVEMLTNVFALIDFRDVENKVIWQRYADVSDWHIKDGSKEYFETKGFRVGVDDSEEVEFTVLEISRLLAFIEQEYRTREKQGLVFGSDDDPLLQGITRKLNKMLKEKE